MDSLILGSDNFSKFAMAIPDAFALVAMTSSSTSSMLKFEKMTMIVSNNLVESRPLTHPCRCAVYIAPEEIIRLRGSNRTDKIGVMSIALPCPPEAATSSVSD
jgi:hypothetical protein